MFSSCQKDNGFPEISSSKSPPTLVDSRNSSCGDIPELCVNAFRHAFWGAGAAYRTNSNDADVFLTAHESDTPPNQQIAIDMDIHNNTEGINYHNNNPTEWKFVLAQSILCNLLCEGDLKVFEDPSTFNTILISTEGCEKCGDCE